VQERALKLPDSLRALAGDYVGFFQGLAQQHTLLERHCFVVLPDHSAEVPAVSLGRWLRGLVGRWLRGLMGRRSHVEQSEDPEAVSTALGRRLYARSDLVARQLGRSGLRTHRLASQQVAELLHRCWSPELARVQRLREELGAYTTLVVGSRRRARHMPKADESSLGTETETPSDAGGGQDERLLGLGTRTLADLIAPSACEVRSDHLRLDGQYARVLVVTAYPRLVGAGWLSLLVESDLPIELSLHVRPLFFG